MRLARTTALPPDDLPQRGRVARWWGCSTVQVRSLKQSVVLKDNGQVDAVLLLHRKDHKGGFERAFLSIWISDLESVDARSE